MLTTMPYEVSDAIPGDPNNVSHFTIKVRLRDVPRVHYCPTHAFMEEVKVSLSDCKV